jgi:Flp pilus assembly protein TadD
LKTILISACAALVLSGAGAAAPPGYAPSDACAPCHPRIAETYARTGMARSFGVATEIPAIDYQHEASAEFFSTTVRDGKTYLRRQQLDSEPLEKSVDYWIGSGNHARGYLSRTAAGELIELPVTWYRENGGHWGMSPGYAQANHAGFGRKITGQCLFCHNAYPDAAPTGFPNLLPSGIDCQRCHGPGQAHIDAASRDASPDAIRSAIVNPARLNPDRRMEICLQCHLETTSLRLPAMVIRFDRGIFSYQPGEPLQNYALYFDHAPRTGHDDKFEFAGAPYRLRKSAGFLASGGRLTCTTCHNPHDSSPPDYRAICRTCHAEALDARVRRQLHPTANDCVGCHMPQRRPTDAIQVTITDHLIRKRPDPAPRQPSVEQNDTNTPPYRGLVAPYYPPSVPHTAEDELYFAVAQVRNQANLSPGIQLLEAAIAKYSPGRGEFYLELADALRHHGDTGKAIRYYEEARARAPQDWHACYGLGLALSAAGSLDLSLEKLRAANLLAPGESAPLQALARTLTIQGHGSESLTALRQAAAVDPDSGEIRNDLGTALFRLGDNIAAEKEMREAVRLRPEIAGIHVNLAETLARSGNFADARRHFEFAIRLAAAAEIHSAYATALAAAGDLAASRQQYQQALRLNPNLAVTHNNLGMLLLRSGDLEGAIVEYRQAITIRADYATAYFNLASALAGRGDLNAAEQNLRQAIRYAPDFFEAHLKLGRILAARGQSALAEPFLTKAAQSSDPAIRQSALDAMPPTK